MRAVLREISSVLGGVFVIALVLALQWAGVIGAAIGLFAMFAQDGVRKRPMESLTVDPGLLSVQAPEVLFLVGLIAIAVGTILEKVHDIATDRATETSSDKVSN